ncbi:MAG: S8 family peptidase, partial [Acidobacteriaceae bacterium]|nr:S8 family peptidase [Acidobacteriaceae bacterium]
MRTKPIRRTIPCLTLAAIAAWSAPPHKTKLAGDLTSFDSQTIVPVIIQWNSAPDDRKDAKVANLGGTVRTRFKSINGGAYNVSAAALQSLIDDPDVAYVTPDRPVNAKLDNTAAAVNASAAWSVGLDGSGIGIAVIDSGISPNNNLGYGPGALAWSYDFTASKAAQSAAAALAGLSTLPPISFTSKFLPSMPAPDAYGHGEHVAGILASGGQASDCPTCTRLLKGITPGASLIDLKVLDANGQGSDSNVILAIETAMALKNVYNIRIINLSVGRPVFESYAQDPLCQAVEAAWKAGIVVVVAAGNEGRDNTFGEEGYGTINAPGNDPYVITVGAMNSEGTPTRTDDLMASYSSKGPTPIDHFVKPDLVAPGNQVVSLLAPGSTLQHQGPKNSVRVSYYDASTKISPGQLSKTYFMLSGTSMATPVVSAAAALLFQANPNLTPDQVKAILMGTSYKVFPLMSSVTDASTGATYTDYYDILTVGAGYLDIAEALSAISNPPASGTALSPVAVYDPNSGIVMLSFDPGSIWSLESVSSSRTVWGAQ